MDRINQMQLEIKARENEVGIHQEVLKANIKSAEQERHRITKELAEKKTKVQNLQIKYKALIQR